MYVIPPQDLLAKLTKIIREAVERSINRLHTILLLVNDITGDF